MTVFQQTSNVLDGRINHGSVADYPHEVKQQEPQDNRNNVSPSKRQGMFKIFDVDPEVLKHTPCDVRACILRSIVTV